jgi:anti-anti-sigma factor
MRIEEKREGSKATVSLEGRLDTVTTPEVTAALEGTLDGVSELILELSGLEYVSSAGLRLILTLHKQMNAKNGRLVVRNSTPGVRDVLEMTGFTDFLALENVPGEA